MIRRESVRLFPRDKARHGGRNHSPYLHAPPFLENLPDTTPPPDKLIIESIESEFWADPHKEYERAHQTKA